MAHRNRGPAQEFLRCSRRNVSDSCAGHDESICMDWISRIWHQNDIARRSDGLREIGKALFRAKRYDNLAFRVQIDAKTPLVIFGCGTPQSFDAA